MSDTVEIPKELLRRVMAEVEELRTAATDHLAEAEALRTERDGLRAERDALRSQVAGYKDAAREMQTLAEASAVRQAAAASSAAEQARRAAEAGRTAAERDLSAARADRDTAEHARHELERTHPLPPRRVGATDAVGAEPAEALQRAFVAWCRRGSPLISRAYLFAAFLREAAPGLPVAVRPVFRDRGAAGIAFSDNPAGVEYWLATVGPVAVILPQPSSPYAFTELTPVYRGALTPDRLVTIELALPDSSALSVAAAGHGALTLASTGHVRTD